MGRPKKLPEELKIHESVYLLPDVHKWLKDKSIKRDSTISSLLNVIVTKEMTKEKAAP